MNPGLDLILAQYAEEASWIIGEKGFGEMQPFSNEPFISAEGGERRVQKLRILH